MIELPEKNRNSNYQSSATASNNGVQHITGTYTIYVRVNTKISRINVKYFKYEPKINFIA